MALRPTSSLYAWRADRQRGARRDCGETKPLVGRVLDAITLRRYDWVSLKRGGFGSCPILFLRNCSNLCQELAYGGYASEDELLLDAVHCSISARTICASSRLSFRDVSIGWIVEKGSNWKTKRLCGRSSTTCKSAASNAARVFPRRATIPAAALSRPSESARFRRRPRPNAPNAGRSARRR